MKRALLVLVMASAAVTTGIAVADKVRRDDVRGTLRAMIAAEESPSYTADVVVREQRGDRTRVLRLRVTRHGGQTHVEPLDGAEHRGGRHRVRLPITDVDLLVRNYDVSIEGEEAVAGRAARKIAVRPRHPDRPSCTLWIDRERSLLLRYETRDRTVDTESIRFEAKPVERRTWKGPEFRSVGQEELRTAVGFPVGIPLWLPRGFRFHKASAVKWESAEVLHILYTDGLAIVSVSQFPEGSRWGRTWDWMKKKGDTIEAGRVVRGGRTMLTVVVGGVVITVGGSIAEQELKDVLESMDVSGGKETR